MPTISSEQTQTVSKDKSENSSVNSVQKPNLVTLKVEHNWSSSTVSHEAKIDLDKQCGINDFLVDLYSFLRSCGWTDGTIDKYLLIPGFNYTKDSKIVDFGKLKAKKRRK